MSDLTDIGITGSECPYCGQTLQKRPGRKAKAPCCGKDIYVRTRPLDGKSVLLRENQLQALENQRAFEAQRPHMAQQAREHLACTLYQFVEVCLSSKHPEPDMCDLYAGADLPNFGDRPDWATPNRPRCGGER